MIFEGIIRRFGSYKGTKAASDIRITGLESLAIDQVAPIRLDMSRAGRRFLLGNSAAITGIAPVQVLPTTAAQWVIWNNDPSQSYAFEELGVYLTSGTPGVGGMLLACLFQSPAQVGANVAGAAVASMSNGGRTSKAIVKSGVAITTPSPPAWYPVATNPSPNAVAFAGSVFFEHRNLEGGLIVPPGAGLGLAVVAPAGTSPLFAPFANWTEQDLDLE